MLEEIALRWLHHRFEKLSPSSWEVHQKKIGLELSLQVSSSSAFGYHGSLWTNLNDPLLEPFITLPAQLINEALHYEAPITARGLMNQLEAEWRLISIIPVRMWFILELAYAYDYSVNTLMTVTRINLSKRPTNELLKALLVSQQDSGARRERFIKQGLGLIKQPVKNALTKKFDIEHDCLLLYCARVSSMLHHFESNLNLSLRYPLELPRERKTLSDYRFKGLGVMAYRCLQPELTILQNDRPLLTSEGVIELSS